MTSSFKDAPDKETVPALATARNAAVTIFATFVPKPGYEYEVQRALQAVVPPTRSEPGCLRFDLYAGLEPVTTFRLFEIFMSQQAVEAHRETLHYRLYRASVIPLLQAAPVVTMMAPLDAALYASIP